MRRSATIGSPEPRRNCHSRAPQIRSFLLLPFADALTRRGIDPGPTLARHGICAADLNDAYRRVALTRFIAFCEDAAAAAREPKLGLLLGGEPGSAQLGSISFLMKTAATFGEALARFSDWSRAMQEGWQVSLAAGDIGFDYTYRLDVPDASRACQDVEHSLANICGLIRERMGPGWAPLEVHLEHSMQGRRAQYDMVFRAPVFFEQPVSKLVIAAGDLAQKMDKPNFALVPLIDKHLRDLAATTDARDAVIEDVSLAIARHLGTRAVTLDLVARELGFSSRSLQRRLSELGMSFRELLAEQRRRVAETMLGPGKRESLTAIAISAGYADGAVLSRAFKNWTGSTPSDHARRSSP